jgi:hypothetical protein
MIRNTLFVRKTLGIVDSHRAAAATNVPFSGAAEPERSSESSAAVSTHASIADISRELLLER